MREPVYEFNRQRDILLNNENQNCICELKETRDSYFIFIYMKPMWHIQHKEFKRMGPAQVR